MQNINETRLLQKKKEILRLLLAGNTQKEVSAMTGATEHTVFKTAQGSAEYKAYMEKHRPQGASDQRIIDTLNAGYTQQETLLKLKVSDRRVARLAKHALTYQANMAEIRKAGMKRMCDKRTQFRKLHGAGKTQAQIMKAMKLNEREVKYLYHLFNMAAHTAKPKKEKTTNDTWQGYIQKQTLNNPITQILSQTWRGKPKKVKRRKHPLAGNSMVSVNEC